jgi:Tfp pilus assembly protein PilW
MSRLLRNKTGLTLAEMMIAVLLLSVVFMGVSSLCVASQRFYITSSQKVMIGYEVQYAIQHIYKNTMRAIGDETSSPSTSGIQLPNTANPSTERLDIRINTNDPLASSNYSTITTYSYYISGNTLIFDNGVNQESLIPKATVTAVNFTKTANALTGYITAYYSDPAKKLTFYFSCYPRMASFN